MEELFERIKRFEVIDEEGRKYVNMAVREVEYSIQHDGMTLKIFVRSQD